MACSSRTGDFQRSKTHLHSALNVLRMKLCIDANQSISGRLMSNNLACQIIPHIERIFCSHCQLGSET